jgi:hypothetical protein
MQKFNHHGNYKYYENVTNWLNMLGVGDIDK